MIFVLTIYLEKDAVDKKKELIIDVEQGFKSIKLKGTDLDKKIINEIDQAKWNDSHSFIDRFDYKLYMSELSTGCKAALLVSNKPEAVINIRECGLNARDTIVSLCKNGNVLAVDNGITFVDLSDGEIHVKLDQYEFTTIDRLNEYIQNERPFEPNMEKKGIKHV